MSTEIEMVKNPKKSTKRWKLTLFAREKASTWDFKGTFEDALIEADLRECEVDFDVTGVLLTEKEAA